MFFPLEWARQTKFLWFSVSSEIRNAIVKHETISPIETSLIEYYKVSTFLYSVQRQSGLLLKWTKERWKKTVWFNERQKQTKQKNINNVVICHWKTHKFSLLLLLLPPSPFLWVKNVHNNILSRAFYHRKIETFIFLTQLFSFFFFFLSLSRSHLPAYIWNNIFNFSCLLCVFFFSFEKKEQMFSIFLNSKFSTLFRWISSEARNNKNENWKKYIGVTLNSNNEIIIVFNAYNRRA